MEPSWAILGPLGAILGPSWAILGPCWAILGPLGAILGGSWAYLGPRWGPVLLFFKRLKKIRSCASGPSNYSFNLKLCNRYPWDPSFIRSCARNPRLGNFGHVPSILEALPSIKGYVVAVPRPLQPGLAECAKRLNPARPLVPQLCRTPVGGFS